MPFDALILGRYFCDLIFTGLPRMPRPGEELYGTGFEMIPGGSYITAVAMHRLGLHAGWACDFGDDFFSRFVFESARAEGLDETLFRHHPRPLRLVTVAASSPGDRAFISFADPPLERSAGQRALETASTRLVFLPHLTVGQAFSACHAQARDKGMLIAMDCQHTQTDLSDAKVCQSISQVDIFLPNAVEARQLTGTDDLPTAIARLAELCPLVIVKDGANGAYAAVGGSQAILHAPALQVNVVDTTGAGDCFDAGFLKAWLDGRPMAECLRWGNVCGGLSTTAVGGATAAPRLETVLKCL